MMKTKNGSKKKGEKASTSSTSSPSRPEKRLKRYRSKATGAIVSRIERALSQRLYLIHISIPTTCPHHGGPSITLTVLGSTGNVYEITLSKIPSCNCPDHAKGNLCKHLLFVMLKVVGLKCTDPLVYQSAYITKELEDILSRLERRTAHLSESATGSSSSSSNNDGAGILANEAVRQKHQENSKLKQQESSLSSDSASNIVQRKSIEEGVECPICFDDLGGGAQADLSKLTYCQQTCGTNFHAECIRIWTSQGDQRDHPTCPACRQPWTDVATGGSSTEGKRKLGAGDEGYENLGDLQGQSRVRDTSTYQYHDYDWRSSYKRRRHW